MLVPLLSDAVSGTLTRSVSVLRVSISCGSCGGVSGWVGAVLGGFGFWLAGFVWANAAVSAIATTRTMETARRDAGISVLPNANSQLELWSKTKRRSLIPAVGCWP